jgi:hypothetical protein
MQALNPLDNQRQSEQARLLDWLRTRISRYHKDRGAIQRVVLVHLEGRRGTGGATPVQTCLLPQYTSTEDLPSPDEIERTVNELCDAAFTDASVTPPGMQRYLVDAFYEHDPNPDRHAIALTVPTRSTGGYGGSGGGGYNSGYGGGGSGADIGDLDDAENPSTTAIVAQHMRFTEGMMKHTIGASGAMMRVAFEQNIALAKQNQELIAKHMTTIQTMESLLNESKARELAEKKSDAWIAQMRDFADMLKLLAPHLINKIAGKPVMPYTSTPEEVELATLMASLQPEQLDMMKKVLNPHQLLALIQVVDATMQKHGVKPPEQRLELVKDPQKGPA